MDSVKKNPSSSSATEKLTKILRNREYVKRSTERKKAYYEHLESENKKLKIIIANADLIHKQLLNVHLQLTPEQNQFLINLKNDTFKQETELTKQFTQIQSTLSTRLVGEALRQTGDDTYINNYMSEMHISMGNLRAMEEIMQKADGLRAITLDKIHNRFIKKQFAMALLAISAYLNRITTLSYMWISRPKS
ncbi:transcription factor TGA2.3-like [Rutidosis leptorrhynchoides]|uniref:transcription factor TGA2.3-like n=1 Tax=Rutidosis leptorrhynchoides TaxID=125765 RepID=UPI003A99F397